METKFRNRDILLSLLLIVAIVGTGIFYIGKNTAVKNLDKEKLKTETLLSEKIKLDETLKNFKVDLQQLSGKNKLLDQLVADTRMQLLKKESEVSRLLGENHNVKALKSQILQLEAMQRKLQDDIRDLDNKLTVSNAENLALNGQLNHLSNQNNELEINNAILKAMVADNYRVEALKGRNDKLTINARRADKLAVSFDLPTSISTELKYVVTDPAGAEYFSDKDFEAIHRSTANNDRMFASSEPMAALGTQRAELVFKPEFKLQKGVYHIRIYNKEEYLGSTQFRLR